jgi:hypothetical protein
MCRIALFWNFLPSLAFGFEFDWRGFYIARLAWRAQKAHQVLQAKKG